MSTVTGIHHITAITADAQKNIDFYTGVLGLRMTKLTVNFDDPQSYHLYYGDELGRPGTNMTFFAWPGGARGRIGPPQVAQTAFAVPADSLAFWESRLDQHGIACTRTRRFGEDILTFTDPDDIVIEIAAAQEPGGTPPKGGPIAPEHAIRGFHSVTLAERSTEATVRLLSDTMGFSRGGDEGKRQRFRTVGGFASIVDVLEVDDRRGAMGTGVVHHVAFRTPDDEQHAACQKRLVEAGRQVTPIIDRKYFHSIYFREPGGILFEIATDGPGFLVDESPENLGQSLRLPPQYEPMRAELEKVLPPVRIPPWA